MVNRKLVALVLCLFMIFGELSFIQTKVTAETDVTPPVLNSISIDKTSVVAGDKVKIRVEASDNGGSGIDYISVVYNTPITNKDKRIILSKIQEGIYEGTISLSDTDESGVWKVNYVYLSDILDNSEIVYNSNVANYGLNQDLSNCNFELTGTITDVTPPVLNSISIDKTSVVAGDSVKIRVEASDNGGSGIDYISVVYRTPITNKDKRIILSKTQEGIYEGTISLSDTDESGVWKVYYVYFSDILDNSEMVYNSNIANYGLNQDLSNCNFELTGTTTDVTPPVLNSISIDKTSVVAWDSVKIRVEASDNGESGIDYISVVYNTPITNKDKRISLSKTQEGIYEGTITLTDIDELGVWKINHVYLSDVLDNSEIVYNSNIINFTPNQDLSNCNFELKANNIASLPVAYVINNEYWSGKVIEGDLYVGPQAVLTINGPVTVTGNIYVLGAMNVYGSLTVGDTIYAKMFHWGYGGTLYNGTVLLQGGTHSIGRMSASNVPVDIIPWKIYEANNKTIAVVGNMLNITGAIVPVADLYVDGTKINYYYNGTFNLQMDVTNKESLTFETVDVFGKRNTKTYYLTKINEPITVPVNEVTLDVREASLKVGESLRLNPTVSPLDATIKEVIYSSGNSSIAVVDESGNITAVGPGTTDITVSTVDGRYTASCKVNIIQPVAGITLDKNELSLNIGQTISLTPVFSPENSSNKNILWSSSDNTIAEVDSNGKIAAMEKGTAVITATTVDGGYKASCTVTVLKQIVGISLDKSDTSLRIGEELKLIPSINPVDASNKSIVWSSNNIEVANVDQNGIITALSKGTATITARTVDGNYEANCTITVLKPVTGINLDKNEVMLEYGESTTLTAVIAPEDASNKNFKWSSSNSTIATVDQSGRITGVGAGSTVITATSLDGGFTSSCKVVVKEPIITVTLDKTTTTLNKGTYLQLEATVLPAMLPNKNVSWSSSNPSVASVDSNGLVTAKEKGTAVIAAKTQDGGKTAQCTVTVTAYSIINKVRYGGVSRFGTAVEVSKAGWATSENVVLVNAYGFADALTGVPFANVNNAPILLTDPDALTRETSDEIVRLRAKNIYILGGTGVVSEGIEDSLNRQGYNVYRIAGSGRFETAIGIGEQVIASGGSKTAILTTAYNYPDALAISSYAAINKIPILYTDPESFTDSTREFFIQKGITKVIIPGGIGAVSAAIENELKARGIEVQRIAGADRFSTAFSIVNTFKTSFKDDVMLATGANFPDALAGGALAAKLQIPILLVEQSSIDAESAGFIRSKGNVNLYLLGGSGVISDSIIN